MPNGRQLSVNEIKRVLKPTGHAYLSLGAPPPFGYMGSTEWEEMLKGFKVERKSGPLDRWAVVSLNKIN